jgi:hypothetical protein
MSMRSPLDGEEAHHSIDRERSATASGRLYGGGESIVVATNE